MNTNYIFGIFGAILVVAVVVYLFGRDGTSELHEETVLSSEKASQVETLPKDPNFMPGEYEEVLGEPELESEFDDDASLDEIMNLPKGTEEENEKTTETSTVIYSDQGFSPKSIAVNLGDSVTWINESSRNMWVASAIHPTHNDYPEESVSDCAGSTFDACIGVGAGDSWSFTFLEEGIWRYHDHLNASRTGTVEVK